MSLKKTDYFSLKFNPTEIFAKDWMLLTAGTKDNYNTMTVSWGHIGSIWGHGGGKPSVVVYVRPQRYTKQFVDKEDLFTLCVFDDCYRKALGYLGTHSGRDGDKVKAAGLTPVHDLGTTYFAEAKTVFVCRKMYQAPILESGFCDKEVSEDCYPRKDFHDLYIAEIIDVLTAD